MREEELQGNIRVDAYKEVADGYSVWDSTRDYLRQWAHDNAAENAKIADDTTERVAKVCKVKVCKNGNLFVGCYDEDKTEYVNFFVEPAEAVALVKTTIVQPVYTTTPQGRKVRTGWDWVDDQALNDAFKDLRVVYAGKDLLEVF